MANVASVAMVAYKIAIQKALLYLQCSFRPGGSRLKHDDDDDDDDDHLDDDDDDGDDDEDDDDDDSDDDDDDERSMT